MLRQRAIGTDHIRFPAPAATLFFVALGISHWRWWRRCDWL